MHYWRPGTGHVVAVDESAADPRDALRSALQPGSPFTRPPSWPHAKCPPSASLIVVCGSAATRTAPPDVNKREFVVVNRRRPASHVCNCALGRPPADRPLFARTAVCLYAPPEADGRRFFSATPHRCLSQSVSLPLSLFLPPPAADACTDAQLFLARPTRGPPVTAIS